MIKSSAPCDNDTQNGDFIGDYLLYLLRTVYQGLSSQLYPKLQSKCDVTPEEWRILARMVSCPAISIKDLSGMVMQPEIALRQTADWMMEKGLVEYADSETLKVTAKGADIAAKLRALAIEEESALLSQLPAGHPEQLKSSLKALIEKLG